MKFHDGNWLIREGYTVKSAVQAHEVEQRGEELTAYVSPIPIMSRGNMLDTLQLTVKFHSPAPGVIGIKLIHYAGVQERGPQFELTPQSSGHVTITETETETIMTSGTLSAHIRKGEEWSVAFYRDGERLTGSGPRSMAYITEGKQRAWLRDELDLGVGEFIYGLGERFTAFVKNGQTVDIWNQDGGTSSEQTYKNIPFYVSNKGYGVFVNQPELVSFEVGSEKVKKVQFSVEGESLEYFVIDGPSIKDVLGKYTDLTGKPALPPAWSFGLWLTTSFTTNYDETTVNSFVDGMAERDLPLHVFHFDCFWMKEYHWTDFKWDERTFPDPVGMLKRLKEKGLKICVWINPYIAQRSRLFEEGKRNGYLVKKANGDVWQWDLWQPGMALVDFTNPAACEWFASYLRDLVDMGVDSFKTDFGERIPTDVVYHDGSDPFKMHNFYTQLYNEVVFNVLEEKLGKGEAALFARSATVGGQKFPVHWGGDCYADYESMAESLRGGLSLGLSGFGFWSHDIGGFENTAPTHVFKRWLAFGLLSSHSRLHGSKSYRVPWAYDQEAVDVTRYFTKLKSRLMPYLFDTAAQAPERGLPSMRAMILEFQDDPTSEFLDRQYMLGENLLVAPVFTENGDVQYYLPQGGTWTHVLTGETKQPGWHKENYSFDSLPLFARPNAIVAFGANDLRPDYDYSNGVDFHVYALEDGRTAYSTVRDVKGAVETTVAIAREGKSVVVSLQGSGKAFSVTLNSIGEIASVSGASASFEGSTVIVPAGENNVTVTITLK
ncbi:glycoside hydrolase family 31 [Paenibacillus curdlanolyticus YK9]|uniref:alpha-D-xyloside xylohydrolase n=1 Tax=Paenibacillus curdlanolyticus YK9 TaxID=717606 RepID=E0I7C9_9BACL|nr:alpha-xylosidase [Paenibacillus curdlanolyticus]EFM11945.1 glycoside hydrolase family 31 [Paenibacillus curdlanolyticus YK9]